MKRSITVRVNRRVIFIVAGDCASLIQEMQKSYPRCQMRYFVIPKKIAINHSCMNMTDVSLICLLQFDANMCIKNKFKLLRMASRTRICHDAASVVCFVIGCRFFTLIIIVFTIVDNSIKNLVLKPMIFTNSNFHDFYLK